LLFAGTANWYSERRNGAHSDTLEAPDYRFLLSASADTRKDASSLGAKAQWKVSLNTKSAAEANILFLHASAALEQQFEEIRVRIKTTGEPLPSQRDRAGDMIAAHFQGPERDGGGLDGTERLLLARLEIDRGLRNMTPPGAPRLRSRVSISGGRLQTTPRCFAIWRYASATAGTYARVDMAMERRLLSTAGEG
jgi:hypothetical protein